MHLFPLVKQIKAFSQMEQQVWCNIIRLELEDIISNTMLNNVLSNSFTALIPLRVKIVKSQECFIISCMKI